MDTQIIAVYCLCDEMLKSLHHYEDPQCQITDAEIMTTAIVAMLYFRGNFETARRFMSDQGYMPRPLSKGRFNRRLHRIAELFLALFSMLGETWKTLNESSIYVIDSFPIAACDNYRIIRSKRYRGVEFFLTPGSYSDTSAMKWYYFGLVFSQDDRFSKRAGEGRPAARPVSRVVDPGGKVGAGRARANAS